MIEREITLGLRGGDSANKQRTAALLGIARLISDRPNPAGIVLAPVKDLPAIQREREVEVWRSDFDEARHLTK
jgi:hypothetical protein